MAKGKRKAASNIRIDPNVRCQRIYPVEDNTHAAKTIAELKTVGIKPPKGKVSQLVASC